MYLCFSSTIALLHVSPPPPSKSKHKYYHVWKLRLSLDILDASTHLWAAQCLGSGDLMKINGEFYVTTGRSPSMVYDACFNLYEILTKLVLRPPASGYFRGLGLDDG